MLVLIGGPAELSQAERRRQLGEAAAEGTQEEAPRRGLQQVRVYVST